MKFKEKRENRFNNLSKEELITLLKQKDDLIHKNSKRIQSYKELLRNINVLSKDF